MIKKDLIEELIYLSNNKRFISKDLIKKVAFDEVSKLGKITRSRFEGIRYSKIDLRDSICYCDLNENIIEIDYEKCLIQSLYDANNKYNPNLETNINVLLYVCHEVEHLKEYEKMLKNNIESTILRLSSLNVFDKIVEDNLRLIKPILPNIVYNKLFDKLNSHKYYKLYNIMPPERIAEIGSYKYIIDSLYDYPNFKDKYNGIFSLLCVRYIGEYFKGYDEKGKYSPTLEYVKSINSNHVLEKNKFFIKELIKFKNILKSLNEISIEEKMRLGLLAKKDERDKLKVLMRNDLYGIK